MPGSPIRIAVAIDRRRIQRSQTMFAFFEWVRVNVAALAAEDEMKL
jgi:hypothetical protein